MAVDICTEVVIDRPQHEVVEYASDLSNSPEWYAAQGPFPMETTYTWTSVGDSRTRMTLRNRGEPVGFAKISAPVMAAAIRRANGKDLATIQRILERRQRMWPGSALDHESGSSPSTTRSVRCAP
jgi:hypothetical protein